MGFVRDAPVYELHFEDPAMEGLEVQARSVPTGQLVRLIRLASRAGEKGGELQDLEAIDELFKGFAKALVKWNLEENVEGEIVPVPTDLDGVYTQDMGFVLQIVMAWITAIAGVPDALGKGLGSGVTFPEGSLPMAPLSPSLSSLTKQS